MRTLGTLLALTVVLGLSGRACAVFHPGDSPIRAIQFVDEREGWAVGDDGVIWHSINGGQSWEQQQSGSNASFRAVHFLTPYTGWVVGRHETPGGSRGIVLVTTDGGLKWTAVSATGLPGLNCVRFFNQRDGIVAGDGSDTYPTGLFTTSDAGRTWRAVAGKRCASWFAADFADAETGVLGGPWSQLAPMRGGYFGAADVDQFGTRSIRGLKIDGNFGVAVGQGGLILTSSESAGMKWGFAQPNHKEVIAQCDFEAVSIHAKHIWVVGRPGTFVLHSPDRGQTWEFQKTGQPLPLHAVYFVNENLGWAAGEMGTMLATKDGGKSWKVIHQAAQRAAVLFVHSSSKSIPLDSVALLSEEEGYHTAAVRFTCAAAPTPPSRNPDDERAPLRKFEPTGTHPKAALDPDRISAAMRLVGGSAGESLWQFPLPQYDEGGTPPQLIAHWDRVHGDRSNVQILRQLVLAIRMWRPEVIVTDGLKRGAEADSSETILVEALREAFKLAADPEMFPEHLTGLKLTPWSCKKLYASIDKPDPAAVKMPIDEVKTRLGDCARDFVQPATMLLGDAGMGVDQRYYYLIATRIENAVGDAHLMEGIQLAHGGQARRNLAAVEDAELKARPAIEKAVQKRRTLETLVRGQGGEFAKPEQVLAQIMPAIAEMPGDFGARAAYTVANQYVKAGQWVMAREAFLVMADKYPTHQLTLEAYRWLIRFQCSSEARRRQELGQFVSYSETEMNRGVPVKGPGFSANADMVTEGKSFLLRDMESSRTWFEGTLAMEPRIRAFGPMYANDPAMQLCVQSARRQLGDIDAPRKWLSRYLSETAAPLGGQTVVRGADPWRDCAMAELWMANRTVGVLPAKPLAYAKKCETKPKLDGFLDDECWHGVQPLSLATVTGDLEQFVKKNEKGKLESEYTAKAWFTYDNEFFYVAVQCTRPPGKRVPPVAKRDRDMDLRAFDRISILIDLDRDYQTYYHLQIDERGCLAEDCWGDKSWNPNWFVAIDSDDNGWTAEAAIPLKELTSSLPLPGNAWAVNVTRIVPGKGVQAWSTPADATPRPEGMGLMQFIQSPRKPAGPINPEK